jgi:hypothetical protein
MIFPYGQRPGFTPIQNKHKRCVQQLVYFLTPVSKEKTATYIRNPTMLYVAIPNCNIQHKNAPEYGLLKSET